MTDVSAALNGLDAARRAGWARAYAAEARLKELEGKPSAEPSEKETQWIGGLQVWSSERGVELYDVWNSGTGPFEEFWVRVKASESGGPPQVWIGRNNQDGGVEERVWPKGALY